MTVFRDLFAFYLAQGGDTSCETTFGDRNWDDVVDPYRLYPLRVVFNHDTGDVRAEMQDGRILLVDTVTARWGPQETIGWFREPARGDWPPRPLSRFQETIRTVNRCFRIQERLAELPRVGRQAGRIRWVMPAGFMITGPGTSGLNSGLGT